MGQINRNAKGKMKVSELIELLGKCNPESDVHFEIQHYTKGDAEPNSPLGGICVSIVDCEQWDMGNENPLSPVELTGDLRLRWGDVDEDIHIPHFLVTK